jgi:membrane protease YdiL (CAAX protease family)
MGTVLFVPGGCRGKGITRVIARSHKMQKAWLKVGFFIFGYASLIGTVCLSMLGTSSSTGILRDIMQPTVVELLGVIVMWLMYKYLYQKLLPEAKQYRFKLPNTRIILGIFCVFPLVCFIEICILQWNQYPELRWSINKDITWEEIEELFLQIPFAAVVGPIFEEMCCRVFPLSACTSKKGKTMAAVLTSFLFAFLHLSSWKNVLFSGLLLSFVYIITQNITVSILIHMAINFSTILLPGLSGIYALAFPKAKLGVMGLSLPVLFLVVSAFAFGVYLLIKEYRKSMVDRSN